VTSAPVWWIVLLATATVVDGVLAGASLDQSIKQLPVRHRIGARAFSAYSRAADLANGVVWYASLGIGGALLTLAAASLSLLAVPAREATPALLAGGLAIAHSFTTARGAPINFSQRSAGDDEAALRAIFARFERWQTLRAILQVATFVAMVWALAATATRSETLGGS
jgi:hypothetical protein